MSSLMTRRKKQQTRESVLYSQIETDEGAGGSNNGRPIIKKRRRKRRKHEEEPFLITNLKVGSIIIVVCLVAYGLYIAASTLISKIRGDDEREPENLWSQYVNDDAKGYVGGVSGQDEKIKTFPNFEMTDEKINAYNAAKSIMANVQHDHEESVDKNMQQRDPEKKAIVECLQLLEKAKQEFALLYGGENAAKEILNRGIVTFQPSHPSTGHKLEGIQNTARRIFHAKNDKTSFKLSFAGSSAVAGYGNYRRQTFPSVLIDILSEPIEKLGIDLDVRNAGIADIASFPYGWCLDNFMGTDVDAVSWDSSMMNRADTDAAFESYLRRVVTMDSSPMLVIREGTYSESRRQIIQKYVDSGALIDPIVINVNAAAEPFLELHEDILPLGFQDWLEFGAPDGAPGKIRSGRTTRLSVKQHELIAWLISMHFFTAIELAADHILGIEEGTKDSDGDWLKADTKVKSLILPRPQAENVDFSSTLMFGRPLDEKLGINSTEWQMDEMHCGTTFEPILSGNLEEMVVSGSSSEDLDLLLPRGPMLYFKKWVMDLGFEVKQTAFSFQKYNFDYKFQKKAYYGVKPSGNLTMFIPFIENGGGRKWGLPKFGHKKKPSDALANLVLCEVNSHVGEKQCNMVDSMSYLVGGIDVKARYIESNGVSYQGKKLCVSLDVPLDAKWTSRAKLEKEMNGKSLREKSKSSSTDGLSLQISVSDELIFWKNGPCSISHVLWEQKRE